jgi:hypothetical protein
MRVTATATTKSDASTATVVPSLRAPVTPYITSIPAALQLPLSLTGGLEILHRLLLDEKSLARGICVSLTKVVYESGVMYDSKFSNVQAFTPQIKQRRAESIGIPTVPPGKQ